MLMSALLLNDHNDADADDHGFHMHAMPLKYFSRIRIFFSYLLCLYLSQQQHLRQPPNVIIAHHPTTTAPSTSSGRPVSRARGGT